MNNVQSFFPSNYLYSDYNDSLNVNYFNNTSNINRLQFYNVQYLQQFENKNIIKQNENFNLFKYYQGTLNQLSSLCKDIKLDKFGRVNNNFSFEEFHGN